MLMARIVTRPDFSGTSHFEHTCPESQHDPRRDVKNKKLIIHLNDCGIIEI